MPDWTNPELARQLISNSVDGIVAFDKEYRCTVWNPAMERITGVSRAEVLGREVFEAFPLLRELGAERYIRAALEGRAVTGPSSPYWTPETHRQGYSEAYYSPVHDESGMVVGAFVVVRDPSDHQKAEEKLLRQAQYVDEVIRNVGVAMAGLGLDGTTRFINPAVTELTGFEAAELVGENWWNLLYPGENFHQVRMLLEALESSNEIRNYEMILTAKGGQQRVVSWNYTRQPSPEGDAVKILAVGMDVTAHKESEARIAEYAFQEQVRARELAEATAQAQAARERAERSERAKSRSLATMSHEIRTPMGGVLGMLELALQTGLTAEQRDYLQSAHSSAESLLAIIDDILDFSKIEAGKLELESVEFQLEQVIEGVAEVLAPKAHGKHLELHTSLDPGTRRRFRGDSARLRQVLLNLAGNAIKFTPQGHVLIAAQSLAGKVEFRVVDTGIGIAPENYSKIFESFSQADDSTTRNFGGTGLGLAICRQLVERMGGEIGVESELGRGSTFWFTVPLEALESPARVERADGERVLVVDPYPLSRELLVARVAALGFEAQAAPDAGTALQELRRAPYRFAIIDLHLPDKTGEQLAQEIRSDPDLCRTRLVVLISYRDPADRERWSVAGFDSWLRKPIREETLRSVLLGSAAAPPGGLVHPATGPVSRGDIAPILVAEDNPVNQKVAVHMLRKLGYRAVAVDNGRDTVEAVDKSEYALVLMDVHMPEMDGLEATTEIRRRHNGNRPRLPIIALSASAMKEDRDRCLAAGMDDYLTKPVSSRQLREMVEKWIR